MIDWILFLNITFFVIIGELSSDLLVILLKLFCKKSQLESDIEKEILEIRIKLDQISMIDEFAKYAKFQRKLNSLKEDLKVESKENRELFDSMKYIMTFAVDLFWNAICFYIVWNNLNTPLLHFESSWLLPISSFIGWPSSNAGDVGILAWYIIVKNVTKRLRSQI